MGVCLFKGACLWFVLMYQGSRDTFSEGPPPKYLITYFDYVGVKFPHGHGCRVCRQWRQHGRSICNFLPDASRRCHQESSTLLLLGLASIAWLEWATTGEKRSFARPLCGPRRTVKRFRAKASGSRAKP